MSKDLSDETKHIPKVNSESSAMAKYLESWRYLSTTSNQLWLIYGIAFFHCSSFFTFLMCFSVYMTDVQNISDSSLSLLFTIMGITALLFSVLVGNFGDRYGLRFTLILGTFLHGMKYLFLIIFTNIYIQVACLIVPGFFGAAMVPPALQRGLKIHTSDEYRSLAVSCYWSVFFAGNLLGGVVIQCFFSFFEKDQDSFRFLFIYLLVISIAAFILSFFLKDISQESQAVNEETPLQVRASGWEHTREILILKKFWRVLSVIMLLTLIKSVFVYQITILPLYMDRDLGNDTYYGLTIILNQVIIIISTPMLASTVYYIFPYDSFVIIGFLAVISPLPFLFGPSYASIMSFIVISSIGEGLLNFRVVDYILEIAPRGKESVMIALSAAPTIFSIIFSGIIGGVLMENFCPEDGEKECWKVWGIISLITFAQTLMLIFARPLIEDKKFEANPYMPCTKESKEQ